MEIAVRAYGICAIVAMRGKSGCGERQWRIFRGSGTRCEGVRPAHSSAGFHLYPRESAGTVYLNCPRRIGMAE